MKILRALIAVSAAAVCLPAAAHCHLFFLEELYSNADGSIQFITLKNGSDDGENLFSGEQLQAAGATGPVQSFTFPNNLNVNTANRHVLVATAGFAALGIVTPDFTIPAGFLSTGKGSVTWTCNGTSLRYGSLPTDGVMALFSGNVVAQNVATNFKGDVGSIVAGGPAVVTVVEYYNAGLDHYFMTASTDDQQALDAGLFPGWARTQQTFKASSAAAAGLNPVCRFYIPPIHGDSHFFSAQPSDCAALLAWAADPANFPNFSGYVEEHAAAFYETPPDATGACPMNTIPVFRLWNQRFDSNHRYTTSQAVVAQMQARNYVVEGAQPNLAAMCAPG
ncbi:MAG TPA: hypothetical protein PLW68_14605 [Casimicrobiaceae bacterium]|nr:hypothetical protein [Casimicrobiaceae bacterium]